MSDLTDFLLARIAEDEAAVRPYADGDSKSRGWVAARVLADSAAKRRIVDDLSTEVREAEEHGDRHDAACAMHYLRLLALPYADHPDYREEWRW